MSVEALYLALKGGIPQSVHNDIRAFFVARMVRAFKTRGLSENRKWEGYDREPKYRAYKREVSGDMSLLKWKGGGILYGSLTQHNDPDQVFRVQGDKIVFGSRVPWADDVARGGTGPFGEKYPGRNFLHMGDRSRKLLARQLAQTVAGNLPSPASWRLVK